MSDTRTTAYAAALLAVARAENNLSEVEDELFRVARAVETNSELRGVLSDPHIPVERRQQIVEDLLGGTATPVTTALVSLVVGTGRIDDLGRIVDELVTRSAAEGGVTSAEVRSAVPLTDDQRSRLEAALAARTGRTVSIRTIVDPTIVGGIVAQIGDAVIDGSVRTRLTQLRDAF